MKPIEKMLVDFVVNNELLSFMDGFSGYNKFLIAVEDIPKTALDVLALYSWSCLLVSKMQVQLTKEQ